jgi:hypothetical protein
LTGGAAIFGDRFDPSLSAGFYFGVADASRDGVIEGLDTGSLIGAILIVLEMAVFVTDTDLTDWGTDAVRAVKSAVYLIAFCYGSFFGDYFYTLSIFYLIMAGAPSTGAAVTGFSSLTAVSFGLFTASFTGFTFILGDGLMLLFNASF